MQHHSKSPPRPLYQYEHLRVEPPSFRLLRISRELEDGLMKCELVIKDFPAEALKQRHQDSSDDGGCLCYNALSYEWGRAPVFGWILLNDGCINVGENLFHFLQTARVSAMQGSDPQLADYLWIDALCINQQDVQEKQHQIKQMGSLYERADNVFVWLGPRVSKTINAGATELRTLGKQADEIYDRIYKNARGKRRYREFESIAREMVDPTRKALSALIDMVYNTYWNRMWIIQEILRTDSAWVMIGNHTFSWALIKTTLLSDAAFNHKLLKSAPTARLVEAFFHEDYAAIIYPSVSDTVARLCQGKCQELRDKVYAVLGLCKNSCSVDFPIDYSVALPELLHRVLFPETWNQGLGTMSALIAANTIREALEIPFSVLEKHWLHGPNEAIRHTSVNLSKRSKGSTRGPVLVMHHKKKATRLQFELADIQHFDHPFQNITITICHPDNPDAQSICKVECRLDGYPLVFSDETFVQEQLLSPLSELEWSSTVAFPIQTFIFLLRVVHNTLMFSRLVTSVAEGKGQMLCGSDIKPTAYIEEESERFASFRDRHIVKFRESVEGGATYPVPGIPPSSSAFFSHTFS